jgi:hypothetical protein
LIGVTDKNCFKKKIADNMRKLTILFILISNLAFAQVDSTNIKAIKVNKKNLTYIWYGRACPSKFTNMEYRYGFRIKCSGCNVTKHIKRQNRRVIKQVNRVYGKNWFEENKMNFINT